MPNSRSTKKSLRGSKRKELHNSSWKRRYKTSIKDMKTILKEHAENQVVTAKLVSLQKVLDKAAKEKVIHKNKANRLKSKYAREVSAASKVSKAK